MDLLSDTYETMDGNHGRSEFFSYLEGLGLREKEDSWHNPWMYGTGTISRDATPSELPYEHTQEVWCAREAMKAMDKAGELGQPFCIQVSLQKPHHPLLPQRQFWDLYDEDVALPETFDQDPAHRNPAFRDMWRSMREIAWDYAEPGEGPLAGPKRVWRGPLACISQVDDVFGMLLDSLSQRNLDKNTIVIYTSDHGCYHTIHGIPEKAPGICSEAVCKVPLIWRVPGLTTPGAVRDQLIELVDVAPTLTHLCGTAPIESADGLDATGLLSGRDEAIKQEAVTENVWSRAIRWDRWRLVHYVDGTFAGKERFLGELYDVVSDPNETQNLHEEPAYGEVVAEGRRKLLDRLIRTQRSTHFMSNRAGDVTAGDGRAPREYQPRFDMERLNPNYA
jgi:iduronate 2-sulfatase